MTLWVLGIGICRFYSSWTKSIWSVTDSVDNLVSYISEINTTLYLLLLLLSFFKFKYHYHFSPHYLKASVKFILYFLIQSRSFPVCSGLTVFLPWFLKFYSILSPLISKLIRTSVSSNLKTHEPVTSFNTVLLVVRIFKRLVLSQRLNFLTTYSILTYFHLASTILLILHLLSPRFQGKRKDRSWSRSQRTWEVMRAKERGVSKPWKGETQSNLWEIAWRTAWREGLSQATSTKQWYSQPVVTPHWDTAQ